MIAALKEDELIMDVIIVVKEKLRTLVKQYMIELQEYAEFELNDTILDQILSTEDLLEILKVSKLSGSEYVLRKHVRGIMKCYLDTVGGLSRIRIKDETNFGLQLASIGLTVGMSTKGDTTLSHPPFDANVLVMAILTFAIVALIVLRPQK